MKKIILSIDGMTCSACSNGLEKYLNKQNGILDASVNLVMANATVNYDENILDQQKIEKYIKQAGFKSLGVFQEIHMEKKNRAEKIKLIVFSVLSIFLMYVSMGHMIHLPSIPLLDAHANPIAYTVCLFILTIAFLWYGWDILKNGYKNLIHKMPNMDTLVSIGVISSFFYSLYGMFQVLQGNQHAVMNLYFESTAIVIYFVKLGRYLDSISKDRTKDAVQKLVKITPNKAILLVDGEEKQVTLDEIKNGNVILAKPGDKIAVDGEILEGKAHLDEAFITGESKPAIKTVGDKVIAGSFNYDGFIQYRAEKIGKESTVSGIVRLVIEASNTKVPIAKLADKISGYFVPIVIVLAILTFFAYLLGEFPVKDALRTFVTILVVACPCSLGLATPLAIVISEGVCASNGILVKKSEVLENASKMNTIVFDKTGTLTYGELKIDTVYLYGNISKEKIIQIVGSLESQSSHPIAKAFTKYSKETKMELLPVNDFQNFAGYGIQGNIGQDHVLVGNHKLLKKFKITNDHAKDEEALTSRGNSILYVVINGEVVALIGVNDIIRENAKEVIQGLHQEKLQAIMLTGDQQKTAEKIGKELGIDTIISNVLPAQKASFIQQLKAEGKRVIMCGDGINDSPAITNADIGISVKSGTDIAMDSADVILTSNDLESLLKLRKISEKTIRNIKQNLFWAFFYNSIMIPIAMGIFHPFGFVMNPMIASLAMVLSSLTVVLNALRLKQ